MNATMPVTPNFGPNKRLDCDESPPSDLGKGCFSVEFPLNWRTCRETFAADFTIDLVGFYFTICDPRHLIRIASFIKKTEEVLKLNQVFSFSTFSKTNKENFIWIEPSIFWKENEAKRSLFTLLLRCGVNYDHEINNYGEAIFSRSDYTDNCKSSIKRFLFGFTQFNEFEKLGLGATPTGWCKSFEKKDIEDVRKILTFPENGFNKPSSFIGLGHLWN